MDDSRDEAASETLAQTTRQTREKFTHVIQALGTSDSATIGQGPKEALEDAFDRFQLWVGSVGASIDAQRKISLEWRLRDAPEIKERIVELQSDLVEALDDLYAVTTGQRDNRTRAANTVDLDPSSDSDADSVQLCFEVGAVNEAQDILEVVLECVKDLLRLSILIRKATPRDRWNKALQKPKDGRLDDRFDICHVGEKFPKLRMPEHEWLRHRLGRAITQRRQFIRYCREHKNKMQELDYDNRIPTSSSVGQLGLMAHNDVPGYAQTTKALTLNPPVTEGSTHASTLQVTTLEAIRGNDSGAASVATSIVSSLDPEDESEEMLRLPDLQTVSQGHDEFECPLCFTIQSFQQHKKWKKHAYSDLKPYVCCGGKGECDLELFSSRKTWFTHELESHRYHWICFLCQQEPLNSLARFQSHVQNKHAEIPIGQIPEVAQICKRPLQYISALDCPFCDEFEAKLRERGVATVGTEVIVVPAVIFRRHVAAHLEQLALFSLGPQNQPDKEMENGIVESRSDGSVRDADVMEHFLNDQEEFEQDDPAPFYTEQGATRAVAETAAVTSGASLATHEATKRRERKKAEKEQQRQDDLTYSTTSYSPPLSAASDRSFIPETDYSPFFPPPRPEPIEPEVGLEARLDSTAELRAALSPKPSAVETKSSLDDSGPLIENEKRLEGMEKSGDKAKGDDEVERQLIADFVAVEKGAVEEDSKDRLDDETVREIKKRWSGAVGTESMVGELKVLAEVPEWMLERQAMERKSVDQPEHEPSRGIDKVPAAVAPGSDDIAEGAEAEPTDNTKLDAYLHIVPRVRALFDFKPSEPGELQFEKGDIIQVKDTVYKNWWRGRLRGQMGIFPLNYVENADENGVKLPDQAFVPGKPDVSHVRGLYDFQASKPGELQFQKGDVILVLDTAYKDWWWKGSLNGQTGVFPLDHVEKLPEFKIPAVTSEPNTADTRPSPPLRPRAQRPSILENENFRYEALDEDGEPEVREPRPRVLGIDNEDDMNTNLDDPSLLPPLLQVPPLRARQELAARLSQREEVVEQDVEQHRTVPQAQKEVHCSDPRCDRKGDPSRKVWYCKSCASALCDVCWEISPAHSVSSTSRHKKLTQGEMLDGLHQRQATQEVVELQSKLVLSSGNPFETNFLDLSREVVYRGYLWRQGFSSLHQAYVVLFDNYFVLTKPQYIVSCPPIPVDLLVLESFDEPSTFDIPGKEGKQRMFPFRITHLGTETYTFLASSLDEWKTWCDKIVGAKMAHATSLHAQNAEPFRIRVLADSAFAYDSNTHVQTPEIQAPVIKGTTLARALEDAEHLSNQEPVCRAKVNCATSYTVNRITTIVVGTENGVYSIDHDMSLPQWMKVIAIPKVTQVAVLSTYSLFLILSDSSLFAYPLDVLHPNSKSDASRTTPQKLSGGGTVRFFNVCEMNERDLVIYGQWEGLGSTIKVLEPVIQKTPMKSKSRFFERSHRDLFRDFDEFYIRAMCSGLNTLNTTIAIHTLKGFEVITLENHQPWSIPDFESPAVVEIARRLQNQTPLGMFRLDTQEFICCYNESAVYVNQNGDISRLVIMEYVDKANSATLKLGSLLLFHENFVEIRDVQNGRLKQIIEGKNIRCLEGGDRDTVKMVMRHPKNGQLQLVLELVKNYYTAVELGVGLLI